MKPRIYLDYAATTPVDPEVLQAMMPFFTDRGFNPSSLHSEGRSAHAALDSARDSVARSIGAERKEVTFTGSGSEADTHAILGAARAYAKRGRHVVASAVEHHAVLHALDALRDDGFEISLVPVDDRGIVEPALFAAALRHDTILASVAYANNEIGTIAPIAELAAIAHRAGVLFHTDAVQAPEWLPIDVTALGVDMLTLSAHKFYGPKGVGALYVREGLSLAPLIHGGGQEFGRRAGTENVAGIVGFAAALEGAVAGRAERFVRIAALRDRLENGICRRVDGIRINGAGAARLPNNCNVSFEGVDSETLLARLDLDGVAVSAGSACTSGATEPSHVIAALGIDPRWHSGAIRFSLGTSSRESEIDDVLSLLVRVVAELRGNKISARTARLREGVGF